MSKLKIEWVVDEKVKKVYQYVNDGPVAKLLADDPHATMFFKVKKNLWKIVYSIMYDHVVSENQEGETLQQTLDRIVKEHGESLNQQTQLSIDHSSAHIINGNMSSHPDNYKDAVTYFADKIQNQRDESWFSYNDLNQTKKEFDVFLRERGYTGTVEEFVLNYEKDPEFKKQWDSKDS